eukprot:625667-Hanusia_phi.AAC.1
MKSSASSKAGFVEPIERFLEIDMMFDDISWEHFCKQRCGRVRLDNCIGKQRFIGIFFDKFFSSLWKQGKQEKPMIAYGSASFASTGRGKKAVPVKRIKRE